MKLFKKWLILKLCFLLVMQTNGWSQPVFVGHPQNVNRAISGVLQDGLRARGFSPIDPRFANTLVRISAVAATMGATAGVIAVGGITAPVWPSVLISAGIFSAANYYVNLGLDSLTKWLHNSDKTVTATTPGGAYIDPSSGITVGGPYWTLNGLQSSDPQGLASQWFSTTGISGQISLGWTFARCQFVSHVFRSSTTNPYYRSYACFINIPGEPAPLQRSEVVVDYHTGGASRTCAGGTYAGQTGCNTYSFSVPASTVNGTVGHVIPLIPESDRSKQLSPPIIADAINTLWRKAADQPGYDGLPPPLASPITPAEVISWAARNPGFVPTVGDYVTPNPPTATQPSPWALPVDPTAPTTTAAITPDPSTVNPATGTLVNLGPDPATPPPTLEGTPTASQILAPILGLFPGLRSFQANGQIGECPKPSVSMFGTTIILNGHCTVIDSIKPILQSSMTFAWAALALFIILSA